ncbi:pentatricopeptide repeat-containing protein At2g22410, mitochondrial-like [Primulina tabacum]|uniref:pentatricopeptide repeat-containing protein At2g22410, mitochondrial-like n=1 Tax=Primulina tabacum TaxID=48773 RepID=UPI003F5A185F
MKLLRLPSAKQIFPAQTFANFSSDSKKWNSTPNPNLKITNPTLLLIESCNSMSQAKQIQAQMTRTAMFFHLFPVSRLLSFIALDENGDFRYANALFSQILEPNAYVWNTVIRGCVKNGFHEMGFRYFVRMVRECVEMDKRSYVFGLKACGGLEDFRVGHSVHCRIWKVGSARDVIIKNGLIHFYCESGSLVVSGKIFRESEEIDVVSWTSMINGNVINGLADEALKLFDEMCRGGVDPNEVTMVTVFSACARKGDLRVAERIHAFAEKKGVRFSLNVMNAALDMYAKCGGLAKAREIFDNMEVKDVFSWTSMVNGLAKSGNVELAREFFDKMPKRNVISWNAMIAGYSQNNKPMEALGLYDVMERQGLNPMESTLVSVLSACAQSGYMDIGKRIHDNYVKQKRIPLTVILGNAFIDMYAKCGNIDIAREIFDAMRERDLVSYNSMIVANASHGHANKALDLFESMINLGFKPDDITFVGLLSACAHGGLVKKGWGYFQDMELYGLVPAMEHYACVIDLFCRVGLLDEARELIRLMPLEPDEAIWGAVLNGCKMHGNVELGKFAAEKLMNLDPKDSGIYALLASLCANKSKWSDVRMTRSMMRDKGVKKTRGSSSIEVEGEFHEFLVADQSHPESKAIYEVLQEVLLFSKSDDYTSCTGNIDAYL